MKVYKAVSVRFDGKRASFVISQASQLSTIYVPDKEVTGYMGTPVLAFSDLESCQEFVYKEMRGRRIGARAEIWEAKAASPYPVKALMGVNGHMEERVLEWWAREDAGREFLPGPNLVAPKGSVACNSLMLTRRLASAFSTASTKPFPDIEPLFTWYNEDGSRKEERRGM